MTLFFKHYSGLNTLYLVSKQGEFLSNNAINLMCLKYNLKEPSQPHRPRLAPAEWWFLAADVAERATCCRWVFCWSCLEWNTYYSSFKKTNSSFKTDRKQKYFTFSLISISFCKILCIWRHCFLCAFFNVIKDLWVHFLFFDKHTTFSKLHVPYNTFRLINIK
jgi:hypothetical protein